MSDSPMGDHAPAEQDAKAIHIDHAQGVQVGDHGTQVNSHPHVTGGDAAVAGRDVNVLNLHVHSKTADQGVMGDAEAPFPAVRTSRRPRRFPWRLSVALVSVVGIATTAIFIFTTRSPQSSVNAHALIITVLLMSDETNGTSFALPAQPSSSARQLLAPDRATGQLPRYVDFATALGSGGYAVGGLKLQIELQGNVKGQAVTITGVHPASIRRAQPATGALVVQPSQGEGTEQIGFDLDASPTPLARQASLNGALGGAYFDSAHPMLGYGDKRTFSLDFRARGLSYAFNVAIDYEVQGQTFSQLVNWNDRPLQGRATAYLCPGPRPGLPGAEVQHLNQLRYGMVYAQVLAPGSADFIMERFAPAYFARACTSPVWTLH
jgi:hypothetical protein